MRQPARFRQITSGIVLALAVIQGITPDCQSLISLDSLRVICASLLSSDADSDDGELPILCGPNSFESRTWAKHRKFCFAPASILVRSATPGDHAGTRRSSHEHELTAANCPSVIVLCRFNC
jgi:hypothetical protein